jgi:hypothetical protein
LMQNRNFMHTSIAGGERPQTGGLLGLFGSEQDECHPERMSRAI